MCFKEGLGKMHEPAMRQAMQGWGEKKVPLTWEQSLVLGHGPPSTSICSPAPKLCDSHCPWVLTELNLQPSSPLQSSALGLKVLGLSGDWSHAEAISEPHRESLHWHKHRWDLKGLVMSNQIHSYHSGNAKGLGALCQESGTKTKYIFYMNYILIVLY